MAMSEDEKRLTAYHEGGHAIVAFNVPATDPVHKATIIPRGRALGMVMQLPERDKLSMSFEQMTSRLAILMGGRVAEELVFGKDKITSGASSDIEQATRLARAMVTKWGYSDLLGVVSYGENQDEARRLLSEKIDDLHLLAKSLLEYETLSGDEIINALKGVKPNREDADAKRPAGPTVAVPLSPRPGPELA